MEPAFGQKRVEGAAMAATAAYGGLQVHSRLTFKADKYVRLQEHGTR